MSINRISHTRTALYRFDRMRYLPSLPILFLLFLSACQAAGRPTRTAAPLG